MPTYYRSHRDPFRTQAVVDALDFARAKYRARVAPGAPPVRVAASSPAAVPPAVEVLV